MDSTIHVQLRMPDGSTSFVDLPPGVTVRDYRNQVWNDGIAVVYSWAANLPNTREPAEYQTFLATQQPSAPTPPPLPPLLPPFMEGEPIGGHNTDGGPAEESNNMLPLAIGAALIAILFLSRRR